MNYLQIKKELLNLGIDINKFNEEQINEVGAALEQNIQPIFLVANPSKSAEEMREFISSRGGTPYKIMEEPSTEPEEQKVEDVTEEQKVEETIESEEQVVEDTTPVEQTVKDTPEESNVLDTILVEHQVEDQQTTEEPVVEVMEEPAVEVTEKSVIEVAEEPIAEEPVMEVTEEPIVEESIVEHVEEPTVEGPVTTEEPTTEEPVTTEEPITTEVHDDSNTEEPQESVLDSLLQSSLVEEPTPITEMPDDVQESIIKELDINPSEEIPENHGYAGMVDIAAIIHAEMKSMGVSDQNLFNKIFESIMYHNCVHYAIGQYVREFIRNEMEHVKL